VEELHLFIIWKNALTKKEKLCDKISEHLTIIKEVYITWSEQEFSKNLSRFYGTKLPDRSAKEQHIGKGQFLLLLVVDKNPKYEYRETSKGSRLVNSNMFDTKMHLREMTGGGHMIHGTDSLAETNHDLTLLLDINVKDFFKKEMGTKIEYIKKDLFGAQSWKSVEDIFYALNNCCEYVIMRNYEELPEEIYVNEHNDIDILCDDSVECSYVLNAQKVFKEPYRVHYQTKLLDQNVYFDLRYLGDNYYCEKLELEMLKSRKLHEKGFYILPKEEYFYTLLYHALIHKPQFSKEYQARLKSMKGGISEYKTEDFIRKLNEWLIKHKYNIIKPIDFSVYFNNDVVNQFDWKVYHHNNSLEDLLKMNNKEFEDMEQNFRALLEDRQNEIERLNSYIHKVYQSKRWKIGDKLARILRK
jgi:hypothetical protein